MKNNTKKKNKLYLVLALFCIIGAIVGILENKISMLLFYLALAGLFFYLWNKKNKTLNKSNRHSSEEKDVPQNSPTDVPKTDSPIKRDVVNKPINSDSSHITKNFRVAGVSYKQKEIESLACENPDYSLSKKELCDQYNDGDTIYKYKFYISDVKLEPEPTNEHDPNAIKVIADNVHIGYIKAGKCSEVKNLLNSGKKLSLDIEIHGGPYKLLYSDYDDEQEIERYSLESDKSDFSAKISIMYAK